MISLNNPDNQHTILMNQCDKITQDVTFASLCASWDIPRRLGTLFTSSAPLCNKIDNYIR
jgi:hypothetical protein